MGIRFGRHGALVATVSLLLPFAVIAADVREERKQSLAFRSDSERILVNAIVLDRADRFVADLKREDFRIFQDGREQKLANVWLDETPVSVGIVLDVSGSMKSALPLAKQAVKDFIAQSNPEDDFFVVTVGRRPKALITFETRTGNVVNLVNNQQAEGTTALLDSIYLASDYLRKSRHPRKALLVISDGEDNHSRYSKREVIKTLEESDLTLHALGLNVRHSPVADSEPDSSSPGEKLMTTLAESTGGKYFDVVSHRDLARALAGIDIRSQYMLDYRAEGIQNDGKYHKISLKLTGQASGRKLRAYYRQGYYAPDGAVAIAP